MDEEENISETRILIERPLYCEKNFEKAFAKNKTYRGYDPVKEFKQTFHKNCYCGVGCAKHQLYSRLPFIAWIKKYKIKENLLRDFLTGLTIGVIHIPQGMAYSLLARLPPLYGLYTSFFPVLIYMFFGTSRHVSIGTFAFASLMIARTITKYEEKFGLSNSQLAVNGSSLSNFTNRTFTNGTMTSSDENERIKVSIAMAVTFYVGAVQLVMCVFQLGFITNYLAEPLVNGLTTGVGVQVVISQLKSLFGLKLTQFSGVFNLIYSVKEFFEKIALVNAATVIISAICITFLAVLKIHVNERFQKKLIVPIPIELIVVILGTAISYAANLQGHFKISTVGNIPAGFKAPQLPDLSLFSEVILDSAIVAFVIFATNISQANTFATKHKYKINSTQELLAYGAANLISSFLSGFVNAASLARSSVQENSGGKTQLVSLFSSSLVLIVLLWLAPLFRDLPQACLAAIIIVSLKGVLLQVKQLAFYWKVNKLEFLLWIVTFLSIIILDVDIGLGVGVGFYMLSFFLRSSRPYITVLGNIEGTEFYKDLNIYPKAKEIDGIKIIRMEHSIHAINANFFRKSIYELSGVKPEDVARKVHKYEKKLKKNTENERIRMSNLSTTEPTADTQSNGNEAEQATEVPRALLTNPLDTLPIHHLIIDCSPINYVDSVGVKTLYQIIKEYNQIKIEVFLAECRDSLMDRVHQIDATTDAKTSPIDSSAIHLTTHDAVSHAKLTTETRL